MSTNVPTSDTSFVAPRGKPQAARWFHTGAAALLLVLTFLGFQPFWLHGRAYPDREIPPPIRGVVIAHGLAMGAWIVLFLVQPYLVAVRRHRLHFTLGKIGAALAAAIVVLGFQVAVGSARATPPEAAIWGLSPVRFLAVPFSGALAFGVFVALGVLHRKRPETHRAMMLLATLAAVPAAVSRIDVLNATYAGTFWESAFGPFFVTVLLGAALVAIRSAIARLLDRPLAVGWAILAAYCAATMAVARTDAWESFARLVTG